MLTFGRVSNCKLESYNNLLTDHKTKGSSSSTSSSSSSSGRNLWVSGLASSTRAQDLKSVFSKYGKVRWWWWCEVLTCWLTVCSFCFQNSVLKLLRVLKVFTCCGVCRWQVPRLWPTPRRRVPSVTALWPWWAVRTPPSASHSWTTPSFMAAWFRWKRWVSSVSLLVFLLHCVCVKK